MGYSFSKARAQEQAPRPSIHTNAANRSRRARTKARFACSHELDTTHLRPVAGIMLPIPGLTAFDESGGLVPIIDQGHGDRLAGYGVSERLRER